MNKKRISAYEPLWTPCKTFNNLASLHSRNSFCGCHSEVIEAEILCNILSFMYEADGCVIIMDICNRVGCHRCFLYASECYWQEGAPPYGKVEMSAAKGYALQDSMLHVESMTYWILTVFTQIQLIVYRYEGLYLFQRNQRINLASFFKIFLCKNGLNTRKYFEICL